MKRRMALLITIMKIITWKLLILEFENLEVIFLIWVLAGLASGNVGEYYPSTIFLGFEGGDKNLNNYR